MNVGLIFTPFASFSYVPVGIAYLKSYINKELPQVRVKNFDLSNSFYRNLDSVDFVKLIAGLCEICPKNNKTTCNRIFKKKEFVHWVQVALLSKRCILDNRSGLFYNVNKYNKLREIYDLFYTQIIFCIERVLKQTLEAPEGKYDKVLESILFKDDIQQIIPARPDTVGFSIFSKEQLFYSLELAKLLKKKINCKVIFGGAYISHLDKKIILKSFPFIDFLIYKEGELAISGLLKNLKTEDFEAVPNLVFRKNGGIIENKEEVIKNLDQIPFPDFSDYNLQNYFAPAPVLSVLFSRGCFWRACTFCAHHKTYSNPYRTRSVKNLIQELKLYKKMGIRHIWLADEIISADNLEFLNNYLLKENLNIHYGAMLKPTSDFTYHRLKRMQEAGCRVVVWGVESFSQRLLDLMNKGTQAEAIHKVLVNSHKAGLRNIIYMIQGFPTQTEGEILRDWRILRNISKYLHSVGTHNFWLEAGTYIFKNKRKFGLSNLQRESLLNSKRFELLSSNFYFTNTNTINWNKINKSLAKDKKHTKMFSEFHDSGLFYTQEHLLLHLSNDNRLKRLKS